MLLEKYEKLPKEFLNDDVYKYYMVLKQKKISLVSKRVFDILISSLLIVICLPVLAVLAVLIKIDSKGPVIFRQERITTYGRKFYIYKIRTM